MKTMKTTQLPKEEDNHIHISVKDLNVPNKMHLDAQIRFKAQVYKDKTKYTRKQKYKKSYED